MNQSRSRKETEVRNSGYLFNASRGYEDEDEKKKSMNYKEVYQELSGAIFSLNNQIQRHIDKNDLEFMNAYRVSFILASNLFSFIFLESYA